MPVEERRTSGGASVPRLEVSDLHKVFTSGRSGRDRTDAVAGVSFSIQPGEAYGLVGGSGAGKSTVARLVLRLLPATAGRL